MLNKVMLIGNLGADPETRFTQDGTCVCNLRLATTEKFKSRDGNQQEKTEWHRIVLWGRLGEIANQYLTKGARVYIEGKIETHKWEKDGKDQYTTEIRAHEMKMLGGGSDAGSNSGSNQGGNNQNRGGGNNQGNGGNNQGNGGNDNRNSGGNNQGGGFSTHGGGGGNNQNQGGGGYGDNMQDDIPF